MYLRSQTKLASRSCRAPGAYVWEETIPTRLHMGARRKYNVKEEKAMDKILVFDIGGTAIKVALMDKERNVLEREERATPLSGQGELLGLIADISNRYRTQTEGISISMPGMIDAKRGYVRTGGSLKYNNGSVFQRLVEEACGKKTVIENDAKCALLAEMWCGSLADVQNGMVLILGTGVGGGIMLNRQLIRGTHFSAGEVSYCCLDDQRFGQDGSIAGRRCSTQGLVKMAREALHVAELDGRRFFELLEAGNPKLEHVLREYCYSVAVLVYNLQMVLDVQRIAFGGGISRQPRLIDGIREQVGHIFTHEVFGPYASSLPRPEIVACKYFNDSNLVGALFHYLQRTEG